MMYLDYQIKRGKKSISKLLKIILKIESKDPQIKMTLFKKVLSFYGKEQ